MDNVKKTTFEQRMVFILLAVFAVCFVQMLRRLGFIGSKARPAAGTAALQQSKARLHEVETLGLGTVARPTGQGSGAAARPVAQTSLPPTAAEPASLARRDPLVSLLPSEAAKAGTAAAAQAAKAAAPAPRGGVGGGAAGESSPPSLTVRGVIVGGQKPQALIDGGVYGVGDLVKGVRIIAIERDGVLVMAPGGLYRLSPDVGAVLVKREVSP